MTKIFFAGHNNFGNRGCEALVRSVSGLIRQRVDSVRFITPSLAPERDLRQWTTGPKNGIDFVPASSVASGLRWWSRANRVLPFVEKVGRPIFRSDALLEKQIAEANLLIMTGGDTISLDYGLVSLYQHTATVDTAKKLGIPAVLWGASVGPFSRKPHVEKFMRGHLADYAAITVRESETARYLKKIGVENVIQVTDPAFTLQPEEFDVSEILPAAPEGIIGINVSPLVRGYLADNNAREKLDSDVALFIRELVEKRGFGVVLLPHVGPLDGGTWASDYHYLLNLVDKYKLQHSRIRLAPPMLNAAQLKFLISRFRFFIGARTHATIAAFSTGVPTISIAYSVKAKGINRDLFGDTNLVVDTPAVTIDSLRLYLNKLVTQESDIKALLAERIPEWRRRAAIPVESVLQLIGSR